MTDSYIRTGTMPVVGSKTAGLFSTALKSQFQVLYALMLHDIKSRFFGNGLGYVATILWPTSHILIITIAYIVSGRIPPYGNDTLLFVVTGVLPYITWNYISRFCQMTVIQNSSYLQYPVVKFLDLIFARIALEIVTISIITAGALVILPLLGSNVIPNDPQNAAYGLFSAILLGIGFGILGAVITRIWPLFMLVYVLFLIGFWFTAGVAINPEAMPTAIGDILAWNPLLHSIEWLRLAYFPDAPTRLLNKSYVIYVGVVTATLGLIGQRVLKPFSNKQTKTEATCPASPATFAQFRHLAEDDMRPEKSMDALTEAGSAAIETGAGQPGDDVHGKIERLHDLLRKDVLTEADFSEKKTELLARI